MPLRNKKIAIVAPNAPPFSTGGVGSAHYNLFLALQARNFDVTFFTFADRPTSLPNDPPNMVRYRSPMRIRRAISAMLRCLWRVVDKGKSPFQLNAHLANAWGALVLRRRLKKFSPDILILPDRSCPGFFIGKLASCKMIQISHHNPSRFSSPLIFGVELSQRDIDAALYMERKSLRHVDVVVCPSHYMQECFIDTFGPDKPVKVIPNLLDQQCMNIHSFDLHGHLKIDPNDPIVYIPSAGTQIKGERYVFEILRRIHENCPEAAFFLSGPMSPSLPEEIKSLSFQDRVYAPGSLPYLDNLARVAACSLCVSPTLLENYGMALCEASSMGIPVVAFDTGGNADIVDDADTGYLVPYLDVNALIAKAISLLQNETDCREMGIRAKSKIHQDMEKAMAEYCRLLSEVG